jgi:signal transduction histidine kinase
MSDRGSAFKYPLLNARIILLIGFGGLLLLMAYTGIDAVRDLTRIRNNNDSIRRDFLVRNKILNQIRSDVYLSGTYLRDYILEPDSGIAEKHRASLERVRGEIDDLLARYATLVRKEELEPVAVLRRELASYWAVVDPALHWNAEERRTVGYPFWRAEVVPRRANMLAIADRIDAVNEGQLTEGGRQVSSLFADFRRRLTITLLVTLGLGFVLAAFSFGKVLLLERQAAGRYEEIARARGELKDLSARIVDTQENERRAISRELHDEVGQTLSALMVRISNLSASLPSSASEELKNNLEGIRRLAGDSVKVVRNISLLLRPSMLDDLGLLPALQWQAREVSRQTGMHVSVAAEDALDELPETHKTCLYRLVQEALHNCSRHSGARTVRITVRCENNWLRLSVQDDGTGFEVAREKGLGLLGMQERVTSLGGEFLVKSEPGCGTLLAASLPLRGGHKLDEHEPDRTYSARG